ncbi:MAG: cytochrome C [Thalassobius sp.]|nr:cytochrome C [Thalassovita sp.]
MKNIIKIAALFVTVLLLIVVCAITYIKTGLPDIEAPELTIEATPERLARGEYLANNVMGCLDCHAERDWTKYTGPTFEHSKGSGGEKWSPELNFPGHLIAPNITQHTLKDWTDGELYRAITAGVSKDGSPLFPIMPYTSYGQLEKEDIYSIIAYIKTLDPIAKATPARELDFPVDIIVHTMPQQGTHSLKYEGQDAISRGKYLITAAACFDCHTMQEQGQYLEDMAYAGGFEFPVPTGGVVRSANITPDQETGIGKWSEAQFVDRFKQFQDSSFVAYEVQQGEFNSFMPWTYYAGLSERDLTDMYAYLMSLDPIEHQVEKFTSPNTVASNEP